MNRILSFILVLIAFITACSPPTADGDLPTLAEIPTDTPTTVAQGEVRSTFPPTWTPTPSITPSQTPSSTLTPTVTPSLTITNTLRPTLTPSPFETVVPGPSENLVQLALQTTLLPSDFVVPQRDGIDVTLQPVGAITPLATSGIVVSVNCQYYPAGGFGTAFATNGTVAQQLGCPVGAPPVTQSIASASQVFERGLMMWIQGNPSFIYVLFSDGTYLRFADTYDSNVDPISAGETPPSGLLEPVRGFGKIWRNNVNVKGNLGWAVGQEVGNTATLQVFELGQMVFLPNRGDILALFTNPDGGSGRWQSVAGQF